MIDASSPVFPSNAVNILATRLFTQGVLDDEPSDSLRVQVLKRPLRPSDPIQCVGIAPMNWNPDEDSFEIRGTFPGPSYPSLGRYWINIQALIKDTDESNGLAVHSVLSSRIKSILYYDTPLRVGLSALAVDLGSVTERFKRSGVRLQRFLSNEIDGSFIYLSTLEFWIETEIN